MELASIFGEAVEADLQGQISALDDLAGKVDALHMELAGRHGLHILAASLPLHVVGRDLPVNRARLFAPNGRSGSQDKIIMTRFEREEWAVGGGDGLSVFETDIGCIGVAICYDCEFPLLVRTMVEAGAELILIPSCTDTLRGHGRVRVGAMARALENQCYTVVSPTVGNAPWSPSVDVNRGVAGVYGPPDIGFPETGIVAEGRFDEDMLLFAEIDLDLVSQARTAGQVLNHLHWVEQPGADLWPIPPVRTVDLLSDLD
ncbi:carbon-nitrogen hydrolase family protein [Nisaea acidiphila]|uniref:Carbon-nitrogen hydrolase family protein n=1 Tax=Nisaea acidiphila TaxID=1862145 RepID=A0A9J7ANW3_9PROT|nr:carbon-nitrogen hydrolase family protein [Nisaea acidiphila]UUX49104.1 carbon-nitrogen hydrolase family protein [Nisaea acidiphila]